MHSTLLILFTLAVSLDASEIHGRVFDPSQSALHQAWVTLYLPNSTDARRTRTNEAGEFLFTDLAPGQYLIEANAAQFDPPPPQSVTLQPKETKNIEITLTLASVSHRVVVTASSTPTPIDATAKALDSFSTEDIDKRAEFALPEVLRQTPGMRVQQLGGPGSLTRVLTRGLRAFDTSLLIDGFRLRDAGAPQGDATAFLSDILIVNPSSVEVLRGSGSSLYGTHAMGGVINLVSDQGGGPLHGEFSLDGGGLGLFRGTTRIAGEAANHRLQYSAGLAHLNVTRGLDGDDRARNSSIQAYAQYLFHARSRFSARLLASNNFAGLNSSAFPAPAANLPARGLIATVPIEPSQIALADAGRPFSWGNATFAPSINDPDARRIAQYTTALFGYTHELRPGSSLRLSYQLLDNSRDNRDGPGGVRFPPQFNNSARFDGRIHNANARLDTSIGRAHLISIGYEFEQERFFNLSRDENPIIERRVFASTQVSQRANSAFAQDQIRLLSNRLMISLSGRWQNYSLDRPSFAGGAPRYQSQTFDSPPDAYTGDVAIAYLVPTTQTKFRAHFGNAYRAPALYERFGTSFFSGAFFPLGDPRISPERAVSADAGIDQYLAGSRLRLSATFFYSRLQNVIGFGSLLGRDPFDRFSGYLNTRGGLARGVEFSTQAAVHRNTRIQASYTHTRAQERNSLFIDGLLFSPRIPHHMGTWLLTQRLTRRFELTADMSLAGDSITPLFAGSGTRAFVMKGGKKADLAATYTIPMSDRWSMQLFTRIDNVLNQTWYEDGFRVPKAWAVGGLRFLW